jgi:hypothetical protein
LGQLSLPAGDRLAVGPVRVAGDEQDFPLRHLLRLNEGLLPGIGES